VLVLATLALHLASGQIPRLCQLWTTSRVVSALSGGGGRCTHVIVAAGEQSFAILGQGDALDPCAGLERANAEPVACAGQTAAHACAQSGRPPP
jgi:hypothetical protein